MPRHRPSARRRAVVPPLAVLIVPAVVTVLAGSAVPAAGSAAPAAGSAVPAAGSAVPAAGSAVPAAGSAVPPSLAAYVAGDRTDAQWAVAATHLPAAWRVSTGQGVVVAVVDTGVDATHPDLAGQLVHAAHLDPVTRRIVPGAEPDREGHGTHVAGVIAARADGRGITGVAPGAKVMPIDIDTTPETDGAAVAAAVRYAVRRGARVVNLSIGQADIAVTASQAVPVCAAVRDAVARGVVVVAAAGNDGAGLNLREVPAGCPGAVAVSAVTSRLQPAVWSSFDPAVSVGAPGDDVYSTVPRFVSRTGYAAMSGTSMATPFVAGVAALLLSARPDLTPAQVRELLERTATDVAPAGRDPRTGAGVVDPAAALGAPAPPVTPVPHVAVGATPYPGRLDGDGMPLFDSTYVNWVPDAGLAVTGYRLTRFAAAGVTSVVLPPTQVRAVERVRAGGWTVTALTAAGEVASAPVWSSVDDTGQPPAVQVAAPQRLRASWSAAGSLVVTWRNPARDTPRADRWVLTVNGMPVRGNERPGRLPTRAVVAARELPAGDLTVGVTLGSTRDQTDAEAVVPRAARLPVSGRAVPAGRARYRVDLQVAPSWARLACRRAACPGTVLRLAVAGRRYTTWVDGDGRATASVTAPSGLRRITLAVRTADRSRRVLDMPRARRPALTLSVSRGADGVAPAQSRPAAFSAR